MTDYLASFLPRRTADYWILIVVSVVAVFQVVVLLGFIPGIVGSTTLILVLRWSHLAQHSHAHTPIFGRRSMNEAFDLIVMTQTAMPAEMYRVHHISVHHRFNNRPEDWTGPYSYRGTIYPSRPVNMAYYVFSFIPRAWFNSRRAISAGAVRRRRKNSRALFLWLALSIAGLLAGGFRGFLYAYILPTVALYLLTPIANWLHHNRCDYQTWSTAANSSLTPFNMVLGLNIGYHATHHRSPQTHWADIPALHRRYTVEDSEKSVSDGFGGSSPTCSEDK